MRRPPWRPGTVLSIAGKTKVIKAMYSPGVNGNQVTSLSASSSCDFVVVMILHCNANVKNYHYYYYYY